MRRPVILVGGGGHACVVAEAIRSRPDLFELRGFVDPAPCNETVARLNLPRLGGDDVFSRHKDALAVLGVGPVPRSRRCEDVVARLEGLVAGWATVVHDRAWVSPTAVLGQGTVVMAGACVQSGAAIGRHVVINTASVVEHDVVLGDFVHVAPAAALAGGVQVGAGAYLGMGCRIRNEVKVGTEAVVAMGAVVILDVEPGNCVRGVPAR